ncbi:MAG: transcription elongation factor GreA [Chloroflexi bacterium]|jgi:transcription elongation factor GreA|nr:MAG: transcription elongation factor GreA [Chloroflexota bacterium]
MAQKETYITKDGVKKLEAELEHLRTSRRHVIAERIQVSHDIGGTVDNAEYEEAKNEQSFVEGRIQTIESLLVSAVLIPEEHDAGKVSLGTTVTLKNEKGQEVIYTLVGSTEADPLNGRISNESPVGKGLMDHKVGDVIEVPAPGGKVTLTVKLIV